MADDALSDVLKTVRLTGATYFDVVAQEPWSVHSPARDLILPRVLPGADHLIAYHAVIEGRCYASLVGGEAMPLEAGEVVVFSNGDPHIMSSHAGMRAEPPSADFFDIADAGRLPFHVNLANGGGASAKLVCGYLACDARPFNPLLEALPPMLKAGDPRRNDTGWLGQFIHFAVAEVADKRAGSESVLTKLSELMFIDVVRRYIETLPAHNAGWLAALRDPSVSKALALIHARPSFSWTIEGLARQCGASRSVFRGTLRATDRHAANAISRPMAHAGRVRNAQSPQHEHGFDRLRDRLRVRSRVQPVVQANDGCDAVGLAAGNSICRLGSRVRPGATALSA